MKSLGLDGKVGAPAIVRINPLRAPFTTYEDSGKRSFDDDDLSKLLSTIRFAWSDILELIQEWYPASTSDDRSRRNLETFASCATRFLPNRLLRYDLDTPELRMTFGVSPMSERNDRYNNTPRIVALTGTLRDFHIVGNNICGVADGPIADGRAEYSLLIVRSSVSSLGVSDGVLVHAPLPDSPRSYTLSSNSLLISESLMNCHANGGTGRLSGVACSPEFHPDARAIYDRAIALADRPLDLLAASSDIRNEARYFLKKMEQQRIYS